MLSTDTIYSRNSLSWQTSVALFYEGLQELMPKININTSTYCN